MVSLLGLESGGLRPQCAARLQPNVPRNQLLRRHLD